MDIQICELKKDIKKCFPVMVQLRPNYSEGEFVKQVQSQQKSGYKLIGAWKNGNIVAVAGFRITESLVYGNFIYVDDIITDSNNRSKGYGDKLFDWLVDYAKKEKCMGLHLDSGVQRYDAHRFYLRKKMNITAHHFSLSLTED